MMPDPAEEYGGQHVPSEDEPGDDAGSGVQHHVGEPGWEPGAQTVAQLGVGVFEPEGEQQEQHADLGGQ